MIPSALPAVSINLLPEVASGTRPGEVFRG